jgi:calcineurin-like phosphoesterase family protein
MAKRGWTADAHLGHSNIIKYCERPFRDCEHMNDSIIANVNARTNYEDTIVHVGDFCVKGRLSKHQEWVRRFNCNMVFLRGNHDPNNGVKTVGTSMITRIGPYNVFVSHIPYNYNDWFAPELQHYVYEHCDFAICGHVHEKWLWSPDTWKPCLNVGVDVHKFMPLFDDEVIGLYEKYKREKSK